MQYRLRAALIALLCAALPALAPCAAESGFPIANEEHLLDSIYARHADTQHGAARGGGDFLWVGPGGLTSQGAALIELLHAAQDYGLRPSDYLLERIEAEGPRQSPNGQLTIEQWTHYDRLLTRAAARLISHLHYGRIEPRAAGFELGSARADLDVGNATAALAGAADVRAAIAAIEPRFYHYGLLKASLARYRALMAEDASTALTRLPPAGPHARHAGEAYSGAPALRRLLRALGDLSLPGSTPPAALPSATCSSLILDTELVAALARFQARHGLTADGTLGPSTYAALTTPLAQRTRQIELTLERWRWLPQFDAPPILINIPQFTLFAFRTTGDRRADIMQMPVIVGRTYPRTQTPVFVGSLRYIIYRPYWDVPRSITLREMLPAIRADAHYLEKNELELVRGPSDGSPVVAPTPQAIAELQRGTLRLRQKPGDDNALGLIKFVFPNAHDVYLHSTPARQLFLQSRRAFSHGCIRVSDPVALAAFVLRNESPPWDEERIVEAMHDSHSSRVSLSRPIPVMVLYGTALATESGPIDFFDDIYGHDRKLEALLGLAPIRGAAAAP